MSAWSRVTAFVRAGHADALADRRRRVRHGPHDGRALGQMAWRDWRASAPRAMDSMTVSWPMSGASSASTASVDDLRLHGEHDHGWRARTSLRLRARGMPWRASSAATSGGGSGSWTKASAGSSPAGKPAGKQRPAHLPRSHEKERAGEAERHAWPCVSSMVAGSASSGDLAGPQHELKGLVIALARFQRRPEQCLALARMGLGAREQQAMAVEQHPVLLPQVEMAEPELLVDEREEPIDLVQPELGDLEVEGASKMQRLQIVPPGQRDMIIAPRAANRERELVGVLRSNVQSWMVAICSTMSTGLVKWS